MMSSLARWSFGGSLVLVLLVSGRASAEPYLAVLTGLKCMQCHVNPTGGGLRADFGDLYAQYQLPMTHLDTGSDNWTGEISRFLRVGGDLRYDATVTTEPHTPLTDGFQMQQTRVYLEANVIPERLIVYADEQVAPGSALNREAWVLYWSKDHDWYLKAGQMYLPFGFRLQDQTAFVQEVSGINMTTPDQGVEFGWERGHWDVQADVSNGTAGAAASGQGKQYTLQASYVEGLWRLGAAASDDDASGGRKEVFGAFAGLHTGPIAWLAEADLLENKDVTATTTSDTTSSTTTTTSPTTTPATPGLDPSTVREAAYLIEANIEPFRGNNIKLDFEFLDPNADIHNNAQNRWSLVDEFTPIQFVQLRLGVRRYQGIPQSNVQNEVLYFLELHGFF